MFRLSVLLSEGVCECLRPARTSSHRRSNGFYIGGRHNVGMGVAGWSRGCIDSAQLSGAILWLLY